MAFIFSINTHMLDKKYGYFVTALGKTSEPIRTNKWLVNFNFAEVGDEFPSADILSLHIKNVEMPEIKAETDSMFYFGVERKVVTSIDNAGSISMTVLEGENLIGYSSLLRWNQLLANGGELTSNEVPFENNALASLIGINQPQMESGASVNSKAVSIECYSFVSGKTIVTANFKNIKPVKIGSVKLAYDGNELYKYDVTFEYDLAMFAKSESVSPSMLSYQAR